MNNTQKNKFDIIFYKPKNNRQKDLTISKIPVINKVRKRKRLTHKHLYLAVAFIPK